LKKSIVFFLLFIFNVAYSQAPVVCYGTTTTYDVDTNEGGVSTPNGTAGSTYSWRIIEANSATITGDGTNSISINWGTTVAGTYTIEVVETNASCSAPAETLSVTVKNNPTVIAPNTAVCLGSPTTITATASPAAMSNVYSWTTPAAYTGPMNTNSITIISATLAMADNYVVTVTDVDGCESTPVTAVLTVNSLPSAAITTTTTTEFCAGGNVVLSAPIGFSYLWNRDGIAIVPSETGGSYTASLAGNYTVTTTDSNVCSNTSSPATVVTVNPNPTVTVTASVTQFCDGSDATLSAIPVSGTAPFTYQWMNTLGNIAISGTNASYIASTTSDYRVKVTDSKGCDVTSVAQTIYNRPNPDATITHNTSTTFCAGDNVVLQRGSAALLNHTYQWIKDAVDIATASTNFNYTATESGSYKVRVVDTTYPTNCTTTTANPSAIVVTKINLPVTTTITAH
jgi:hypothetical protein